MGQIDLNPSKIVVLTSETIPFTVEWADVLGGGEAITSPTGTLYDTANGIVVVNGFSSSVGVNGTQTQFVLNGQYLQVNHDYQAVLSVQISPDNKVFSQLLTVTVPA